MTFGYLQVVSTNSDVDYLKLAYAQAISIKNTQLGGFNNVALIIDDKTKVDDLKSPWVFDTVIEWNQETFWNGRSWMDKLTPWDYTIGLDVDMLFLNDYSHWVKHLIETYELFLPSKVYTYRGDTVTSDYYRRCFTANELPNLYSLYTFFKKGSEIVNDFFVLNRHIIKNQTEFKNLYLNNEKPSIIGTDESFALSAALLDITDRITYNHFFPRIVHLKPLIQGWNTKTDKISNAVGWYFDKRGSLKIGNYQQFDIVHYNEKTLITDETINILEHILWKK